MKNVIMRVICIFAITSVPHCSYGMTTIKDGEMVNNIYTRLINDAYRGEPNITVDNFFGALSDGIIEMYYWFLGTSRVNEVRELKAKAPNTFRKKDMYEGIDRIIQEKTEKRIPKILTSDWIEKINDRYLYENVWEKFNKELTIEDFGCFVGECKFADNLFLKNIEKGKIIVALNNSSFVQAKNLDTYNELREQAFDKYQQKSKEVKLEQSYFSREAVDKRLEEIGKIDNSTKWWNTFKIFLQKLQNDYDKIAVTYSTKFENYALSSKSDEYREYLGLQSKGEALGINTRAAVGQFKTDFQETLQAIYEAQKAIK